jgi:hypothetical protein
MSTSVRPTHVESGRPLQSKSQTLIVKNCYVRETGVDFLSSGIFCCYTVFTFKGSFVNFGPTIKKYENPPDQCCPLSLFDH